MSAAQGATRQLPRHEKKDAEVRVLLCMLSYPILSRPVLSFSSPAAPRLATLLFAALGIIIPSIPRTGCPYDIVSVIVRAAESPPSQIHHHLLDHFCTRDGEGRDMACWQG